MHKGQALIIVLLVLALTLTLGLAVVSRSTTETNISTIQEESARALAAAEAGVEKALGGIISSDVTNYSGTVGTSDTFNITSASLTGQVIPYPDYLSAGDVATIKVNSNLAFPLQICWGNVSDRTSASNPAIEVTLYYLESGVTKIGRAVLDPVNNRIGPNTFVANSGLSANCPSKNGPYSNYVSYTTPNVLLNGSPYTALTTPLLIQLRLFFNGSTKHPVGLYSTGVFPPQGTNITATGQAGQSTQKIEVTTALPDPPPFFDAALFSGSSLTQ